MEEENWSELPLCVLFRIFINFSDEPRSLGSSLRVCKSWYECGSSKRFWAKVLRRKASTPLSELVACRPHDPRWTFASLLPLLVRPLKSPEVLEFPQTSSSVQQEQEELEQQEQQQDESNENSKQERAGVPAGPHPQSGAPQESELKKLIEEAKGITTSLSLPVSKLAAQVAAPAPKVLSLSASIGEMSGDIVPGRQLLSVGYGTTVFGLNKVPVVFQGQWKPLRTPSSSSSPMMLMSSSPSLSTSSLLCSTLSSPSSTTSSTASLSSSSSTSSLSSAPYLSMRSPSSSCSSSPNLSPSLAELISQRHLANELNSNNNNNNSYDSNDDSNEEDDDDDEEEHQHQHRQQDDETQQQLQQIQQQQQQEEEECWVNEETAQPTGMGTVYYTDSQQLFVGEMVAGLKNGFGRSMLKNGNSYEGMFLNDQRNGLGTFYWQGGDIYSGEFHDGLRSGHGTYRWSTGSSYTGSWLDGDQHGHGAFSWPNGNRYEGEFVHDERTGKGVFWWQDGDCYCGSFVQGKRTGRGLYSWASGNLFDGFWDQGDKHGFGRFHFFNGNEYKGLYQFGKRNGPGVITEASTGWKIAAEWCQNFPIAPELYSSFFSYEPKPEEELAVILPLFELSCPSTTPSCPLTFPDPQDSSDNKTELVEPDQKSLVVQNTQKALLPAMPKNMRQAKGSQINPKLGEVNCRFQEHQQHQREDDEAAVALKYLHFLEQPAKRTALLSLLNPLVVDCIENRKQCTFQVTKTNYYLQFFYEEAPVDDRAHGMCLVCYERCYPRQRAMGSVALKNSNSSCSTLTTSQGGEIVVKRKELTHRNFFFAGSFYCNCGSGHSGLPCFALEPLDGDAHSK